MRKKLLLILLAIISTICMAFGLTACDEFLSAFNSTSQSGSTSDSTSGDDTSGDDTSGDDTSGDDTSGDDTSGDDTSGDDTSGDDAPKTPTEGLAYKLSNDQTYYTVTGIGTATDTDIVIPSTYNDKPVASIANSAFRGCANLTSITIPDSVTSIGDSAFYNCASLTSITIPDSVTSIGNGAFCWCDKLIEVYNLSSLPITAGSSDYGYVGYYAKNVYTSTDTPSRLFTQGEYICYNDNGSYYLMGYTGSDTELTLPDTINGSNYSIYQCAFCYCYNLATITIPDGVVSIGNDAFIHCRNLTNVTIGDNVTSIGSNAFYGCSSLNSITIPSSVTSIGSAFHNCSNLTSVTYTGTIDGWAMIEFVSSSANPVYYAKHLYINGVDIYKQTSIVLTSATKISSYAFYGCSSLTSITIPNSVTSIGERAFSGCSSLTSITIPNSVTSIGKYAFSGCTGLTEINFNATAMDDLSSKNYVFSRAGQSGSGITVNIGANVTKIPAYLFYPYSSYSSSYAPKITSVLFADNSVCKSIGAYAFSGFTNLTSITIPNSVTSIGSWAFYGCTGLTEINFNATAMNDLSSENYVFSYAGQSGSGITVNIGANVTKIPAYLFENFYATKITSVVFAENSVCQSIGNYAFSGRYNLTSITIPDSVTSIGNGAFSGWYKLIEVYNLSSLPITAGSSDYGKVGYYAKNVYTPTSGASKLINQDGYIFYNDNGSYYLMGYTGSDTDLTLPDTINGSSYSIYQYAFHGFTNLTSITIPNSVTSIGSCAFHNCANLTSITIPDSVTSIGDSAFVGCDKLIEVYNLSSLPITAGSRNNGYVGYNAKNVYTPTSGASKLINQDGYIFYNNNGIYYLMGYMGSDTDLTLPDTINGSSYSIYKYAFLGCSSLTSITIPDSVTYIGNYAFYGCSSLTSVTFENTNGWSVDGTNVTVTDTTQNATYLTSTYYAYHWERE